MIEHRLAVNEPRCGRCLANTQFKIQSSKVELFMASFYQLHLKSRKSSMHNLHGCITTLSTIHTIPTHCSKHSDTSRSVPSAPCAIDIRHCYFSHKPTITGHCPENVNQAYCSLFNFIMPFVSGSLRMFNPLSFDRIFRSSQRVSLT